MSGVDTTAIWLWLAIIASGLYHGINPGMGWPLAVSAGLMDKSPRAVVGALLPLSAGHLAAMLLVLLPFALLIALVEWQRPIQVAAGIIVIGFGLVRLVDRRHPRALGADSAGQIGALVFRGGDCTWRRPDAAADLSRPLRDIIGA